VAPKFIKQWLEGLDPSRILVFDVETNGFLEELDKVHVLSVRYLVGTLGTGDVFNNQGGSWSVADELRRLMDLAEKGYYLAGHNVIDFDIPAIQKVYPWFQVPRHRVLDTLVLSYLMFADIRRSDALRVKRGKLPGKLAGRHSLEAWGYRLDAHKGDFKGPWDVWTQEMEDYCHQDTATNVALLQMMMKQLPEWGESPAVEHGVRWVVSRQERNGIHFNEPRAMELVGTLKRRQAELEQEIKALPQFGPFYLPGKEQTPKRTARRQLEELGPDPKRPGFFKCAEFTEGAPFTKADLTIFNPGSHDHIAYVLRKRFGWTPAEFTDEGKPKLDEAVMSGLTFPGVEQLKDHFVVTKRLGTIAEGSKAWLKYVRDGKLHGRVMTCGAVTGRMSHRDPNLAQVPAAYSPWGPECRALFGPRPGWVQVGCDADGLEARDFAGYLWRFDGGAYARALLEGKKAEGTDVHSRNAVALGLDPKKDYPHLKAGGRDVAKTFLYAFLYGAGDEKLGIILTGKRGAAAIEVGRRARARFLKNMPGLRKLVEAVKDRAKQRGHLTGLDGRRLRVRSQHAALNTLLQSAGAVQMKVALLILDEQLCETHGEDHGWGYIANVHDEWQLECRPALADSVGASAAQAITNAGAYLKFPCPLAGSFKVGGSWLETH